jgi:hypothetical protein
MKPRVFLSHSKNDKNLIEKIANDLRSARVDVWYDEWEIPPGDSFRHQLTKGIDESDLFFVYLTESSANSYWVQHELDTAFIKQANAGRTILALFVDSDDVRKQLPTDIQAIHSPVLNNDVYLRPLSQLISRAWESYSQRIVQESISKSRVRQLELENEIKNLELTIARASSAEFTDIDKILSDLDGKKYIIANKEVTLRKVFELLSNALATSSNLAHLQLLFLKRLGVEKIADNMRGLSSVSEYRISDLIGPLVIIGLVHIQPPQGEILDDYYFLTELGKKVAAKLNKHN